nr:hypothetical protein MACL_00001215 [Theileria orientalis]
MIPSCTNSPNELFFVSTNMSVNDEYTRQLPLISMVYSMFTQHTSIDKYGYIYVIISGELRSIRTINRLEVNGTTFEAYCYIKLSNN